MSKVWKFIKQSNRIGIVIFSSAVMLASQSPVITQAMSKEQKSLFAKKVLYYNINECANINETNASPQGTGGGAPDGAKFPNLPDDALAKGINKYIRRENTSSKLNDLGQYIVASAKNSNVSPFLIVAIAQKESSLASPSDYNVKNGNNSFGRTATESQPHFIGANMWYKWSSVQASVNYTAEENKNAAGGGDIAAYIRNQYGTKVDNGKLSELMQEYAPPSENDTAQYIRDIKKWTDEMVRLVQKEAGSSTSRATSNSSTNTASAPTANSELDGHELPATQGGTGLEDPITAAGNLVGSSETVTFSNHASLGQEYRDYYITMRWNYVKWNWDGTSTSANDEEYNWLRSKPRLVLVTNPQTKKSIITAALEAGPAPWTGVDSGSNNDPKQGWTNPQKGTPPEYKGRVSGLPPEAFKSLGMTSNDQKTAGDKGPDLLYAWAPDQSAKPGPTNLSVDGSLSTQNPASECQCRTDNPDGSPKTAGGDVDKFIKALAEQESGGDPDQPGSAGGARGKYQYIDSTWQSSANSYYPPAAKYPTANAAPESVQDAVAFLEYSKKFKDLDNDLFKLAVSHFYPAANSDAGLLDVVPPANVITPRQYASKLINSIRSGGSWEKIPLKYTEAPEFSKYAKDISVDATSAGDPTGSTLSAQLCSTETGADNTSGVDGISWPVDKKYWDQNPDWFTKPHHDYAAADIPVASGTKVYSITSGKVALAGDNGGCGTSVLVDYEGFQIGYCHGTPGSTRVKPGDTIRSGQLIMLSGFSGHVIPAGPGGAHLHVQIKKGGTLYCPQGIFSALGENKKPDFNSLATSGCSN